VRAVDGALANEGRTGVLLQFPKHASLNPGAYTMSFHGRVENCVEGTVYAKAQLVTATNSSLIAHQDFYCTTERLLGSISFELNGNDAVELAFSFNATKHENIALDSIQLTETPQNK